MRRMILSTLGFVGILVAGAASGADDQASARAVIDKAIKAAGGEKNLAKFNAHTWKEKGTYHGMGEGVPYTGKYAVQWPGQFRMEIENVFIIVLDGDKGWISAQGTTKEMDKDQLAEQKEGLYAGWVTTLLPLKDKAFTLAPLGESRVENRPAVGIRVSRKDHRDVNLFFDKESGLLLKTERRARAEEQGGKEVTQEVYLQDYQKIEGANIPKKIVIKRDGKPFVEAENQDLKIADKLDKSVFAKP